MCLLILWDNKEKSVSADTMTGFWIANQFKINGYYTFECSLVRGERRSNRENQTIMWNRRKTFFSVKIFADKINLFTQMFRWVPENAIKSSISLLSWFFHLLLMVYLIRSSHTNQMECSYLHWVKFFPKNSLWNHTEKRKGNKTTTEKGDKILTNLSLQSHFGTRIKVWKIST